MLPVQRRLLTVQSLVFIVVLLAGGSAFGLQLTAQERGAEQPSKVAASLQRAIARVDAARAVPLPAGKAQHDLSAMSDGLVRVRPSGALEVVVHARGSVGEHEVVALRALGAES